MIHSDSIMLFSSGGGVVNVVEDEREVQRGYWMEHCEGNLSVESMMLDSNASHLDKEERPEVSALISFLLSIQSLSLCCYILPLLHVFWY